MLKSLLFILPVNDFFQKHLRKINYHYPRSFCQPICISIPILVPLLSMLVCDAFLKTMLDSSLEIEFQWRVLIYKASNTILWQVLKMESQVLNFLYFQLSVPTTKTFLRCNIEHLLPICYRYDVINNKFTHPAYSIFYFSGDSFKQHKLLARYFKMLAIVHCIFSWNLTKLIYSETCNYSDIGSLCRTGVLGKLFGRVDSC